MALRVGGVVCFLAGLGLFVYALVAAFPVSLLTVAGLVLIAASESLGRRVPPSRDGGTAPGTPGTSAATPGAEGEGPTMEVRFRRPDER